MARLATMSPEPALTLDAVGRPRSAGQRVRYVELTPAMRVAFIATARAFVWQCRRSVDLDVHLTARG